MAPEQRSKHQDASRKGKAVEHLVAASCILASGGELNASMSLVDDEGVDLVFHRRGGVATLAIQVKSRSTKASTLRRGRFQAVVRQQTFRPRRDLYLLFVAIDEDDASFGPVWLVPSEDFAAKRQASSSGRHRFVASLADETKDQWVGFRHDRRTLPGQLLRVLALLEREGV